AKGAFVGITHSTTREQIQQAVFEGVSFAIRDCLELCPEKIERATVCGGGTRSEEWMQILANVLGTELNIIRDEGPALGAAFLAGGMFARLKSQYIITPHHTLVEYYHQKYLQYRKLYPVLKDF
ncbi:MAG: xylulokinase, partial [Clostridia bacterium]|nr:xylulokinase [Clostridia bacterium]